jgi:hypothetical protein
MAAGGDGGDGDDNGRPVSCPSLIVVHFDDDLVRSAKLAGATEDGSVQFETPSVAHHINQLSLARVNLVDVQCRPENASSRRPPRLPRSPPPRRRPSSPESEDAKT